MEVHSPPVSAKVKDRVGAGNIEVQVISFRSVGCEEKFIQKGWECLVSKGGKGGARHYLVQGVTVRTVTPSLQLLETPRLCCELYHNIHPSCSWPSGWEKMALEVGLCRGEQIYDAQGPAKQCPFEDSAPVVLQASCLCTARRKP